MRWTGDRLELLKKLWAEGLSASQIARRMGDVTRNAVIGKVHRLGLSGRETTISSERGKRRPAMPKPKRKPVVPLPEPEAAHTAGGDLITLLTIEPSMCRWPIGSPGEPGFHYCGQRTEHRRFSYCEAHGAKSVKPRNEVRVSKREQAAAERSRQKAQRAFG